MKQTLSWPWLSTQVRRNNRVSQSNSKLLSLPNELLRLIVEACFAELLEPEAISYRHTDWAGVTQSCVKLYLISKEMWQYFWHHVPLTVDLGKWTFRKANIPPKRHDHLALYLQLPSFIRLPNEIRMPGTSNVRYLNIGVFASWIVMRGTTGGGTEARRG